MRKTAPLPIQTAGRRLWCQCRTAKTIAIGGISKMRKAHTMLILPAISKRKTAPMKNANPASIKNESEAFIFFGRLSVSGFSQKYSKILLDSSLGAPLLWRSRSDGAYADARLRRPKGRRFCLRLWPAGGYVTVPSRQIYTPTFLIETCSITRLTGTAFAAMARAPGGGSIHGVSSVVNSTPGSGARTSPVAGS
jgi:hypothetical protein